MNEIHIKSVKDKSRIDARHVTVTPSKYIRVLDKKLTTNVLTFEVS